MALKNNSLETELEKIKTELLRKEQRVERVDETKDLSKEEKDHEEIKSFNSAESTVQEKSAMDIMLNCDICEYKCKKKTTLKEHKHTKHEDKKCKQCNKTFNNTM